jgi:hypothetical protein
VTIKILEPPYEQIELGGRSRPGMGAVLIAHLDRGIPALAEAVLRQREAPWCPLVLVMSDWTVPAATLSAFEPVPGSFAPLYPTDYHHWPLPRRVLQAVERRPVPLLGTIAAGVERRLNRPGTASTLAPCFEDGCLHLRPARTLTRQVQSLGRLTVRDWRGLARLAQAVASRHGSMRRPLETLAYETGIDPRTARRWLRLATDLPWSRALDLAGWEWLLESALRRNGYIEERRGGRPAGRAFAAAP